MTCFEQLLRESCESREEQLARLMSDREDAAERAERLEGAGEGASSPRERELERPGVAPQRRAERAEETDLAGEASTDLDLRRSRDVRSLGPQGTVSSGLQAALRDLDLLAVRRRSDFSASRALSPSAPASEQTLLAGVDARLALQTLVLASHSGFAASLPRDCW